MLEKQLFLGCICGRFGALMGPQWLGMVDMLIPDTFEIDFRKEMVRGIIFWDEIPHVSHKIKDARKTAVSWVYMWPFWGSDGAPNG